MPHRSGGFVQDIRVDSPASKSGLREADVIVSVNGHTMTYRSFDHYSAKLATFKEVNEICYLRDSTTTCTSIAI
ncbi:MAG: PDZ domain-containing protein [Alteromonadaceae bacterium]|nr:PDZ domain-containing protein [Alteromonadaceae bacterium]